MQSSTPSNSLVYFETTIRRLWPGLRWGSILPRLGRVNENNPPIQELAIPSFSSLLSFFNGWVCNESKPLWSSSHPISYHFRCRFINANAVSLQRKQSKRGRGCWEKINKLLKFLPSSIFPNSENDSLSFSSVVNLERPAHCKWWDNNFASRFIVYNTKVM